MENKGINGSTEYLIPRNRTSSERLKLEIDFIANNSIIDAILRNTGSIIAVLDTNRQIVSINKEFLVLLGVDNINEVIGFRPGEALKCIHAKDGKGGCGTSEFCPSCGAAVALHIASMTHKPCSKICVAELKRNGKVEDAFFKIRTNPIFLGDDWYILLFLQDHTINQRQAVFERMFYHDINNILTGLLGSAEMLGLFESEKAHENEYLQNIINSAVQLAREVNLQKALNDTDINNYSSFIEQVSLRQILDLSVSIFKNHDLINSIELKVLNTPDYEFFVESSIIVRVINNMIKNALEASKPGDVVYLWGVIDFENAVIKFNVKNSAYIPRHIQKRIFQKNFSTKGNIGRGIGTYSMRYFARNFLKGDVYFRSSEVEGTIFTLSIPLV